MADNKTVSKDDLINLNAQINSMTQTLRVFIPKVKNTVEVVKDGNLPHEDTKDLNTFCNDLLSSLISLNKKLADTTKKVNKLETITIESNTVTQIRRRKPGRLPHDSGCYSVTSENIQDGVLYNIKDGATEHSMGTLSSYPMNTGSKEENVSVSEGTSGVAASTNTLTMQVNTTLYNSQSRNYNVSELDRMSASNVHDHSLTVSSIQAPMSDVNAGSLLEKNAENGNSEPKEKDSVSENCSQTEASGSDNDFCQMILKTEIANTSGDKKIGYTGPFSKPEITLNVSKEATDESDDNASTQEQDTNC